MGCNCAKRREKLKQLLKRIVPVRRKPARKGENIRVQKNDDKRAP